MNPVVIIPSYWTDAIREIEESKPGSYDHATDIKGSAELDDCLRSLETVAGLKRVIILLVALPGVEDEARKRVEEICARYPGVPSLIVDSRFSHVLSEHLSDDLNDIDGEVIALRGYGAIKNLGLCVASIFGHDIAVFLDDDEVVLSEEFLIDAVYGMGQITLEGDQLVAKSGFYYDSRNSPYAQLRHAKWYNKRWSKREEFNAWMNEAQSGSRISRSNILCGGCFALHAEAYTNVAFDPWITRGEDLDYLINLRLYGYEVWFDNKWAVKHMPPRHRSSAPRFMQNVYRWIYEYKKLEYTNMQIDLKPVTAQSLMPYPGPWVSDDLKSRIKQTALMRAIGTDEKKAYFDIYTKGIKRAVEYAEANTSKYVDFQKVWPSICKKLWNHEELRQVIQDLQTNNQKEAESSSVDIKLSASEEQ